MKKLLLLLAVLLTLGLNPAKATIRLVPSVYPTIHEAVAVAVAGDVIHVETATIIETGVTISIPLTIEGEGAANSIVQVSGTGHRFLINADGVTIKNLSIQKTDKVGIQNIIGIQANNFTLQNTTISGQFVIGDNDVSRAMEFFAGDYTGHLITGNTFLALRQPAYINGIHTGTISNNYTDGTKGWVVAGGNLTFTNNTWGTNVFDIAIIPGCPGIYYTDIVAMSNANNDAVIEDQRVSPAVLSVVHVQTGTTGGNGGKYQPYSVISDALTRVVTGGKIKVGAGTYNEEITINKSLKLLGAGSGTTTMVGPIGGNSSTIEIGASNVLVDGFTITRDGNTVPQWNMALNTGGLSLTGPANTGNEIRNCIFTGNRTGIDVNNTGGHNIHDNLITNNRTGLIFRNQTDNITCVNNSITNNWTLGVLFLDASSGSNSPLQQALSCNFGHNTISGNWYGQVEDKQTGGTLPLPGANLKNFNQNYWGVITPVVTSENSSEPGYSDLIPVAFGGTAVPPSIAPDILGIASANIKYAPWCNSSFTYCNAGGPGPISSFGTAAFTCNLAEVPILVDNYNNVSAISLTLLFDNTKLEYVTTVPNSQLTLPVPPAQWVTVANDKIVLALDGNPVSLTNGSALFTLKFRIKPTAAPGSTAAFTWVPTPYTANEFASEYGGYGKTPFTDFFHNGSLTIPTLPVVNVNTGYQYCKIQDAIDDPATLNSHVITVAEGTYAEELVINKVLDIRGPNYGVSPNTGIRGPEAVIVPSAIWNLNDVPRTNNWNTLVENTANGVKFNGFTLSGDNPLLNGYSFAGMNVEIGMAVWTAANGFEFTNNVVEKFTSLAFYAEGTQTVSHSGLVLANNKFSEIHDLNQDGWGWGAYVQATSGSVTNNSFLNVRKALQIQPYRVIQNTGVPVVSGNSFSVYQRGIYYNYAEDGASPWNITNNTINACAPPSTFIGGPIGWEGIKVETMRASSNGGTISGNVVNGNGAITNGTNWWGVYGMRYAGNSSTSTQVNFTNNVVSNVEIGFVHDAPADIVLTGNSITASQKAISVQRFVDWDGTVKTYGGINNIDATGGNILNGINPATADLAHLFNVEDVINHKIDEGWRGFVKVKANNTYVTPLSFAGTATTPSIQRGIDAAGASGWTVNVKGGDYPGKVTVNKSLSVLGPNSEISCNGTRITPEARLYPTENDPEAGVLMVISSSNITIKGLMLDGDNTLLSGGTLVGGADVNVSEGICNAVDPTGPDYFQIDHINIANNYFKNFPYQGIYLETLFNSVHPDNQITCNKFENMWEGIQTYAIFTDISYNVFTGVDRAISVHGTNTDCAPFVPRISHNQIYVTWKTNYSRNNAIWINYRTGTAPALSVDNNTIDCSDVSLTGQNYFGFYGLTINDNRTVTFANNHIIGAEHCNIGMYFSGSSSSNISIVGGLFENINKYGILAVNNDATCGAGNVNLLIDGLEISMETSAVAERIGVKAACDPLFSNTVSIAMTNGTHIHNALMGVLAEGTGSTVSLTNSKIDASVTGLKIGSGGSLGSCSNNFITGNTTGIRIESGAGAIPSISSNDFSGNTGYSINNLTSSNVIATCNWWGVTNVHGVQMKANGLVTVDPWLISGDNEPLTTGFQPAPNSCTGRQYLYVNDLVWQTGDFTIAAGDDNNLGTEDSPYRTITKAVNTAVLGTTVYVDAGTYQEQVLINKSIDIVGFDRTNTILKAPLVIPAVTNTVGTEYPIVYASGIGNVINIEDLTIDGDGGRPGDKFIGVHYFESSGVFNHNRITGIRNNPLDGGKQGVNAFVANHTWDTDLNHQVSVTNNIIDDYQKNGITINELNTHGIVTGNTVTGQNLPNKLAQNGIQFGYGSYGTITGNTVTNNIWNKVEHPHEWDAAGILIVGVGVNNSNTSTGNSTLIGPNTVSNNEVGISVDGDNVYGYASNSNLTIAGSTFSNNKIHIRLKAPSVIPPVPISYDKRVDNPAQTNVVYGCIQYAIDEASSGATLNASSGTFIENVTVHTPVTVNGAGQTSTFVIPALSGPNPCSGASLCPGASNIFLVEADNVTIQNLTADGNNTSLTSGILSNSVDVDARNGIITNHNAGVFNNLNIHDVTVKNIYLRGIYASSGGTFNIHHNTVDNVAGEANSIGIFNFGGSGNINYNTVSRANDAIASNWSKGTTYSHNTVTSSGSGIHTDNQGDGSGTTADLIAYNSVSNSTTDGYGIWVFVPYKNVQVMKNNITGVDMGLSVFGGENDALPVFSENTVDGTGKTAATGIYSSTTTFYWGSRNQHAGFTNNIIKNCATGIELEAENGFTNYSYLNYNSITSNTTGVHVTGTGTGVNDLTCNWWGGTSNAAVTAAVGTTSPWVDYSPWLINGTDVQPDTTGFQNTANACLGSPIILSAIPTHVTCNGANNGQINLTVTGGGTPYVFLWTASGSGVVPSGQSANEDLTGLVAGTYDVHVTDNYGSFADLQVIITQPAARIVSGTVKYYNNFSTPMDHVTVELWQGGSSPVYSTTTNSTGTYSFPNVCDGQYTVELLTSVTDNPVGGINSTDAAQLNYWFTNHYNIEKVRFFAGDVGTTTHDYELMPMDASKIVEYFVTIGNPAQPFPSAWTFWKTNDGTSTQHPTHELTLTVNGSSLTQNFYALVSGDFNRSFVPGNLKMQGDNLSLNISGQLAAEPETEIELPVYAGQTMEVGAISMIIDLPLDQVEVKGVHILNSAVPAQYAVTGNQLRIGWQSSESLVLEQGQPLMTIKMKIRNNDQPVRLFLDGSDLNELADASSEVIEGAVLYTPEILSPAGVPVITGDEKSLEFANHPNPFHDKTTFTYTLPKDGDVSLEIYNLLGSRISTVVKQFQNAGDHSVTINMDLPASVYVAVLNLTANGREYSQKIKITRDQK